jgi:hypothetical protein
MNLPINTVTRSKAWRTVTYLREREQMVKVKASWDFYEWFKF